MKIAIATRKRWSAISGHAGQARHWLLFDCQPDKPVPDPQRLVLAKEQLPHHFTDDGPHPLHGVAVVVVASAGDGYIRRMEKWGARVLLTGEIDPRETVRTILAGQALAKTRFDVTTSFCKLRDLFSSH